MTSQRMKNIIKIVESFERRELTVGEASKGVKKEFEKIRLEDQS